MKLSLSTIIIALTLFLGSCKKEEVVPVAEETATNAPLIPVAITVEYRMYAASSNFKTMYTAPNADNTKLISYNVTINKMMHSVIFDWRSANKFKLEASNVSPSTKEVTVEIYINGILYSAGLANSPNGVASAEAVVY